MDTFQNGLDGTQKLSVLWAWSFFEIQLRRSEIDSGLLTNIKKSGNASMTRESIKSLIVAKNKEFFADAYIVTDAFFPCPSLDSSDHG